MSIESYRCIDRLTDIIMFYTLQPSVPAIEMDLKVSDVKTPLPRSITLQSIHFIPNTEHGSNIQIFNVILEFSSMNECRFLSFRSNRCDYTVANLASVVKVLSFQEKVVGDKTERFDYTGSLVVEPGLISYVTADKAVQYSVVTTCTFNRNQSVLNESNLELEIQGCGKLILECPQDGWVKYLKSILPEGSTLSY